jgi:hypothetical protein
VLPRNFEKNYTKYMDIKDIIRTPKKKKLSFRYLIFLNISGKAAGSPVALLDVPNPGTHYDNVTMFIHKHLLCEVTTSNATD